MTVSDSRDGGSGCSTGAQAPQVLGCSQEPVPSAPSVELQGSECPRGTSGHLLTQCGEPPGLLQGGGRERCWDGGEPPCIPLQQHPPHPFVQHPHSPCCSSIPPNALSRSTPTAASPAASLQYPPSTSSPASPRVPPQQPCSIAPPHARSPALAPSDTLWPWPRGAAASPGARRCQRGNCCAGRRKRGGGSRGKGWNQYFSKLILYVPI